MRSLIGALLMAALLTGLGLWCLLVASSAWPAPGIGRLNAEGDNGDSADEGIISGIGLLFIGMGGAAWLLARKARRARDANPTLFGPDDRVVFGSIVCTLFVCAILLATCLIAYIGLPWLPSLPAGRVCRVPLVVRDQCSDPVRRSHWSRTTSGTQRASPLPVGEGARRAGEGPPRNQQPPPRAHPPLILPAGIPTALCGHVFSAEQSKKSSTSHPLPLDPFRERSPRAASGPINPRPDHSHA